MFSQMVLHVMSRGTDIQFGPTDCAISLSEALHKERELATEHARRFQRWHAASHFSWLYTAGARVWVPEAEHVWEGAEVQEDYKGGFLIVRTESGQVQKLTIKSDDELPPLRNPDILIGENDLTSLSYLHEPAVLYNLKVRFCNQNAIYTYCGIVLVAINPYQELPIYGPDTIWAYRGQAMGDLDPHIFAVSEEAYTKLERENRDQAIIVSGESGAGKTVSAKYAMRYFATVGGSSTETQVERKVLASNPIMEAIGNAKTTRNDNSSRFGKFIEIHFNRQHHIQGASMRTYLLEKSRVVFQAQGERNYHIFYQLCAARGLPELADLQLEPEDNFHFTNQGNSSTIDNVDDAQMFEETRSAMTLLGFTEQEQSQLFHILAAVLHLGNVRILEAVPEGDDDEGSDVSAISRKDKHLAIASKLLEIDAKELRHWLCYRRIVSMREVFTKSMTVLEATAARDALAKHIYAQLFSWIVKIINKELENSGKSQRFIGVLDIYGFETFETNSFEQFCINYANEKLQQQFNQHVFKLEQEEYMKEEIEWKLIDFYDNQPCIDLIESKLGILDLLDEECRMPKGTDQSWVEKLYERCNKSKHFLKPRFNNASYIIHHFADNVEYLSTGFLDKNRDTVLEEQIEVLRDSQNDLVRQLFLEEDAENRKLSVPTTRVKIIPSKAPPTSSTKQHKKTVGSQFRDSLNMLMNTLNATTPHYVRCIKPNDSKSSFEYNAKRAVQQLRACGVLETIRISAAGYPSRWTYAEFFQRYRVLCRSQDILWNNMKGTCETILKNVIKDEDHYCFGKTKIFFRAGQVAYLEKLRAERLRACCIMMQKHVRGRIARHKYLQIRRAILGLQRYGRGLIARRLAQQERETRAATRIQKHMRGFLQRQQFQKTRWCILGLQARARGVLARRRFIRLRQNAKAVIIQRHIRGYLARKHFQKDMRSLVVAQSAVRRWFARRQLKKLKLEARSVEHVKKLNKGLENKIISLQQRIEEMLKENNNLKNTMNELTSTRKQLEELKIHEAKTRKLPDRILELEEELRIAKTQLRQEFDDKVDMANESSRIEKEHKQELEIFIAQNKELKTSVDQLNEKLKLSEKGIREELKAQLDKERALLIQEQDQDRQAYQKLLADFHALEHKYESLERENMRLRAMGAPVPAPRSTKPKHERSYSNASSASGPGDGADDAASTVSEMPEDGSDFGYGSVRSNVSMASTAIVSNSHGRLDNIDWSAQSKSPGTVSPATDTSVAPSEQDVDIGLVLKLQQKVKELERDRQRMQKRLEELEKDENLSEDVQRAREVFKLQEMEMENAKLRADMDALRHALSDPSQPGAAVNKEMCKQSEALQEELSRRREECIQLRSVLVNQTKGLNSIASNNYGSEIEIINEDGELVMAFEAQKKINRQLEDELQAEKIRLNNREVEWRLEIEKLREDNERQQRLLSLNLTKNPQNQTEAYMQYEIKRLTGENLDLQEKCDTLSEQLRKHKKHNRILAKKYRDMGGELPLKESPETTKAVVKETGVTPEPSNLSVVRKKDREYMGMFEYRQEDEPLIVRRLIYELKPKIAITLLPGLPAYILFMCIRHTDFIDNDDKVRSLLTSAINGLRKVIKKRSEDLDTFVLWLSNTLRLLHTLKQYSGDKTFQAENTPTQNDQCLRNFDLSQYRQVLSDIAVWIYQGMVKQLETRIQPLVQPAILEHEAISGLSSNKPGGMRGRSASASQDPLSPVNSNPENYRSGLNSLLEELTYVHRTLSLHGMDPELITQVFRQLFYFICAAALNTLLLRKDLCHWSKGMQIRYNISHLEQWLRDHRVQDKNVFETLQPVIQASQLLQARKTEGDVVAVCEMCDKLSVFQIIKILNLYTPADEYEERVPASFIRQIQERLGERAELQGQATLLMDSKFSFPVRFPFNPSNIRLEDIEIPESLHLPMLRKV